MLCLLSKSPISQSNHISLRNFRPILFSAEPLCQPSIMTDHTTENTCVVCFKNVVFYSIGECDHPVCFECSTRMRVLCLQNECPICRQDLARVVFTDSVLPYKELRNRVFTDRQFERQFKIGFSSDEIKQAYEHLLENRCNICDKTPPFRNFTTLSEHMRKVHERHYCDLCVKHLKIFTSERRCYTRQELAHHRRKGDLDDTSHRGHPLCEFCEERFMDADELYRHLRKEHLYCHLCDADGRNLYYASHSALAHHFRTDHYLCEEGECAGQHLTAVFRSEIDLKAHKATVHGRGMNRGASRQARTLELQFNITPHPVAQRTPSVCYRERDTRERQERAPSPPPAPTPPPRIDTRSEELFPRLSTTPAAPNLLVGGSSKVYKGGDQLTRNDKNFPTLGGAPATAPGPSRPSQQPRTAPAPSVAATVLRNSKPVSVLHSQPASASNFRLTQTSAHRSVPPRRPLSDDDYPALDDDYPALAHAKDDHPSLGARTTQPPKMAMINKEEMQAMKSNPAPAQRKKPQTASSEAFPALSSTSAPSNPPQWITVSKSKEKQKVIKLDPPPLREAAFNPVADFPGLPVTKTKPKKQATSQPVKNPFTQPIRTTPNPFAITETKSKKEKKKNNSKKENIISEPTAPLVQVNGLDKKYARDPSLTEANLNNNNEIVDRKIKTIDTVSAAAVPEKNRNTGNGDFSLAAQEFPSLNPKAKNQPIANAKIEYPRENKKIPNGNVNNAPPGFKQRPACDGMTFTNSSGQTFPAPVHTYIPPPDFEARNLSLVKKFAKALGGAAAVENFKVASRAFRDSVISAQEFYEHCKNAMGDQLDTVFPDLVALLPDIAKQQELVVGRNLELEICPTCGQVVAPNDRVAHDTAHWPPLAPR